MDQYAEIEKLRCEHGSLGCYECLRKENERLKSGILKMSSQCDENIYTLKENFKNRQDSDNYPYAFDITCQKGFKIKLKRLLTPTQPKEGN